LNEKLNKRKIFLSNKQKKEIKERKKRKEVYL